MNTTIELYVKKEWARFIQSDEYQKGPECGTLLIADHFSKFEKERLANRIKELIEELPSRPYRPSAKAGYMVLANKLIKELTQKEDGKQDAEL